MLKHVLVPLDGSKLAEQALEHAKNIVAPQGRISLITAVVYPETPSYGYLAPITPPDNKELWQIAHHYLEGIAHEHIHEDVTVDYMALNGDPVDAIIEQAEALHVDAIVMSTHGRSGISRFLLGSVTSKVLSSKVCPVYVIFGKEVVPVDSPVGSWESRK
jgi:nucleotide-binding universal stress UspA family protein